MCIYRFKEWGFEKGWGDNAERVRETIRFLLEVLQAPDPKNLEAFFSRVPNMFNVVLFSIHGYFGQSDVLGLPDTGGQVVYVLDQVVAMEQELLLRIKQQGLSFKPHILVVRIRFAYFIFHLLLKKRFFELRFSFCDLNQVTRLLPDAKGTKCSQGLEPVLNTKHSHILRIPFRTEKGVLRKWVSRFDIYPYLETFTQACFVSLALCSCTYIHYL